MRESRPYGSVRGARDETRVPTATTLFAAVNETGCGPERPCRLVGVKRTRSRWTGEVCKWPRRTFRMSALEGREDLGQGMSADDPNETFNRVDRPTKVITL